MEKKEKIAAALGIFDGIHTAHRKVLKNALEIGDKALCITFKTLPETKSGGILMQNEIKEAKLLEMGFNKVIMLDFHKIRNMSGEEFLQMIREEYGITHFCCGFNYHFGKNGSGNIETLKKYCARYGLEAIIEEEVLMDEEKISSSIIRECLKAGKVEKANKLLSHPIEIVTEVMHGDKRGRTIGFPTINQPVPEGFAEMKYGVYSTTVSIDGKEYKAITNLGIRPTFKLDTPICETYIIDFSGDLYGKKVNLKFNKFIRSEEKFSSLEELKNQLKKDIQNI